MKIIVGLGNPGKKYVKTRHNLGFMVIDQFALQFDMECNNKRFQSLFGKKVLEDEEIILLKPQTFMNLSGVAVKEAVNMYKCAFQDLMIIGDDLDMPLGKMRIRRCGGCGGHRGLESVAASLGSTNFPRLRVGIGRPSAGDPGNYVLSPFPGEEETIVKESLDKACQALKIWIFEGIEACMNKFN
ncbi:MAG: aminoacyl-tRNA hydrolase [Candidatus Jettenia sp.]|nr:MAG: aminoacyl-tRNA hydrolase [Candidatus Jettenia sp.]